MLVAWPRGRQHQTPLNTPGRAENFCDGLNMTPFENIVQKMVGMTAPHALGHCPSANA